MVAVSALAFDTRSVAHEEVVAAADALCVSVALGAILDLTHVLTAALTVILVTLCTFCT